MSLLKRTKGGEMKGLQILLLVVIFSGVMFGQNLLVNPGFEEQVPAFWNGLNGIVGNELGWESSEVYMGFHSFKVMKSGSTADMVGWISDNNAKLHWNNAGSGTYAINAMVKTVGVNTNPANDDAKIGVIFEFKDAAGSELVTQPVWVDQSGADMDWAEITGAAILGDAPASVVIKLVMGKDATGTVYFDNVGCNTTDSWTMGPFNSGAETIKGWLNWYAGDNGSYGTVTDNAANTGNYACELYKPDTTSSTSEIVYYSVPTAVEGGEWYKVGVWVKTSEVNFDETFEPTFITKDRLDERLGLCYFWHGDAVINEGWSVVGGDKYVYVNQVEANSDWTLYEVMEQAPEEATGISVRARFTSNPTGTAYFDDFSVEQMEDGGDQLLANGSFENQEPAFWNGYNAHLNNEIEWESNEVYKGFHSFKVSQTNAAYNSNILENPGFEEQMPAFWNGLNGSVGSELGWESTEVLMGFHSFKVTKSAATDNMVGWVSDNNAKLHWNNAGSGTYALSANIKTVGVNTSPANDDAKIGVIFEFKDAAGAELVTQAIWADQSSADADWTELTGAAILGDAPASVVIKLVMGKDATGTAYFDNMGCNTTDSWTMGPFNSGAETIKGWLNWYAGDNGSFGTVTDNDANSGDYSCELFKPDTTSSTSEIVYYSVPAPVNPWEWYKISVWVKTKGVNFDETFEPTFITKDRLDERLGLCYFWHGDDVLNEGWSVVGGDKYVYVSQVETDGDWALYEVMEQAPEEATGISVRARFTSNPTGTAYFDDFSVQMMELGGDQILANSSFENQKPAFWNGMNAELNKELIWENEEVYMGFHSFKIMKANPTVDMIGWKSGNNAKLYWNNAGSGTYALSANVKTMGVNTNPANDDEKIGVIYEFKNAEGAELVTQAVWADQSAANTDWTELTGVAILSEVPASVVIKLVMGKDATGTAYFDNMGCNTSDSWTMGPFNSGAETIDGWLNWYAGDNGSYGTVTDNDANSGEYSCELYKPDTTSSTSEIVYYSVPAAVEEGEWYKVGVWVKTEGVNFDESFEPTFTMKDRLDERLGLCYFWHSDANIMEGWSTLGGDKYVYVDQTTADNEWAHYVVAEQAPMGATGMSVRARFTSNPTGTAYFDDFTAEKMVVAKPEYVASSNPVGWVSENNAKLHWNNAGAGTYALSAMVKTVSVNTNPATDDEKIGVIYEFKNAEGAELVTQAVWADQSGANTDWTELTGVAILTEAPASVVIKLLMGKDATGTAYFDNMGCNTTDSWTMGPFNSGAETIDGWLNWYASDNGSYGTVTGNDANNGEFTAELYKPDTTSSTSEIVYYSVPAAVEAGEWYKVGVWVKTVGVNFDESFEPTFTMKDRLDDRLGLCYFWHGDANLKEGWSTVGGDKYVYVDQTTEDGDWAHYVVCEKAPAEATGISVRARFTSNPTGTAYFDDFTINKMVLTEGTSVAIDHEDDEIEMPEEYQLSQNYPNPFNPSTTINFSVKEMKNVNISIYNILGQKVRTLVNANYAQGFYNQVWDATDDSGNSVSTGIYVYVMTVGDKRFTKKMAFLK